MSISRELCELGIDGKSVSLYIYSIFDCVFVCLFVIDDVHSASALPDTIYILCCDVIDSWTILY